MDSTNALSERLALSFCPGLCALQCRQGSQSGVLLYFSLLTLQSAEGRGEKRKERQKVSGEGSSETQRGRRTSSRSTDA